MIGHAAEGMDPTVEALHPFLKKEVKSVAVGIIEKDRISGIAAKDDVIESTGIMKTGFARHVESLAEKV